MGRGTPPPIPGEVQLTGSLYQNTTAYGIPLAPFNSFKYLGRLLLVAYKDCKAVVHNLWRSRKKWVRLFRVLIREGADARTLGRIYMALVQAVMLYGLETWLMT